MHASSYENMQRCYQEYLGRSALIDKERIRVLDIGGSDVNGTYKTIFSDEKFVYTSVDLEAGPGVDIVLSDPHVFPFADSSFDVVLCGQVFEHAEFFWKLFEEMMRVLHTEGMLFLIAPSAGPIHRYPVDCYRFYPDSMHALAKYVDCVLVDCWLDERGPWRDLVAVFTHSTQHFQTEASANLPLNAHSRLVRQSLAFSGELQEDVEVTCGELSYLDFLAHLHEQLKPELYIEVGTRLGNSLKLADCQSVAIDPYAEIPFTLPEHQKLFSTSSDRFFETMAATELDGQRFDLAFIDGMHLFEYALRDFMQLEKFSTEKSVVVIDDIFPNHPEQASRWRNSNVWTGDVWRLYLLLREHRPELKILPINTAPTGMLLISGLQAQSTLLQEHYNLLVRKFAEMEFTQVQEELLAREGALHPLDPAVLAFVE